MKKEDLIELGIDENVAKQVMAMHGKKKSVNERD